MSLTNPNTPVSQQDLKDLYEQKILPYIGGAFGLVATGIDSANLYSTTERVIGQWIDGKPLYQKTVNFGSLSNKDEKTIEHGIVNIDRIVHAHALAFNPTTGSGKPLGYAYDNGGGGLAAQIGFNVTRTHIGIFNRGDNYSAFDAYVTIQYTKTTDSAVESYGTDTTYSTDEHVVGSWIDGKPIYQKTIEATTPTCSAQGTVADKYIELGMSVERFISVSGFFRIPNNASISNASDMPLNAVIKGGNTITYSLVRGNPNDATTNANTILLSVSNTNWSARTCYITIQYTKTTD